MNFLAASWLVAAKDLRAAFRDRTGLLLGFALPVALVLVFGFFFKFAFQGETGLSSTTLWVADEDQSDASKDFIARIDASAMVRVQPKAGEAAETAASLRKKVEDGEAHHALVVRSGFAAALAASTFPELELIRDPGRTLEAQLIAIGLLQGFFAAGGDGFADAMTARALELAGVPARWHSEVEALSTGFADSVRGLFRRASAEAAPEPAAPAASADADPGFDFSSVMNDLIPIAKTDIAPPERPRQLSFMLAQAVSGVSVMMLMFSLVACGSVLLQERDQGTLQRLLLSALPRGALLAGKFLFAAIMGALQLILMFLIGNFVFDVGLLRDPPTLAATALALLAATTSFGILIATLSRTQKQAEGLSTLVILVMSAMGGAWFPIQLVELPFAANVASKCTLTYWAMDAFQGMLWHGRHWTDPATLRSLGVLLGFAAVAAAVSRHLFQKRFVA